MDNTKHGDTRCVLVPINPPETASPDVIRGYAFTDEERLLIRSALRIFAHPDVVGGLSDETRSKVLAMAQRIYPEGEGT